MNPAGDLPQKFNIFICHTYDSDSTKILHFYDGSTFIP